MKEDSSYKSQRLSFLKKLDIFGVPIQINFNNESKHTTRFGGLISFLIFGVLFTLLSNLMIKLVNRTNPQVVQEEVIVDNPGRFDLKDDNFSFAVTLLDENYTPFIDETYYTITSGFLYKVDVIQPDGTIKQDFQYFNIDLVPCNKDSFKVEGTKEYFLEQEYQSLYCIKDVSKLYLVGQFEKQKFSVIQFSVQQCQGEKCQKQDDIITKLKKTQLQIYYTTSIVKISNIEQPFQPIGQSQFWETNLNYPQVINLQYINTYVVDDMGLIRQDFRTIKNMLFSSTRTMLSSQSDIVFFKISIFMEKNKEFYYNRSFLKLTEAVSQVGGIYNVLFFIGCLLAQPYSHIELKRKIINSTFSFPRSSQSKNNQIDENQESKENVVSQFTKKNTFTNNNTSFGNPKKENQSPRNDQRNQDFVIEDSVISHNTDQFSIEGEQKRFKNTLQKQKSSTFGTQSFDEIYSTFKVRTIEYFKYYLKCFKCFQTDIQLILDFGSRKIYEFTDICYIVNKLIELEKIKHIIMNEQQLKLFEYIPKPKISQSVINSHKLSAFKDKLARKSAIIANAQLQTRNRKKIKRNSSPQLNILTIMNRSQFEKANEAQKAFNTIYKQQKDLSNIDKKLFLLLDENHIPLFYNNQIGTTFVGQYHPKLRFQISESSRHLSSQINEEGIYRNSSDQKKPTILQQIQLLREQQNNFESEIADMDQLKLQQLFSENSQDSKYEKEDNQGQEKQQNQEYEKQPQQSNFEQSYFKKQFLKTKSENTQLNSYDEQQSQISCMANQPRSYSAYEASRKIQDFSFQVQ